MPQSPLKKPAETTTKHRGTAHAAFVLAMTALDTTWRTLVPGIVGTILGIMADHSLHTTPLVTIIGLIAGIALSGLLIYKQFKGLK